MNNFRIKTELYYLQSHWRMAGRPLVVIPIHHDTLMDMNQDKFWRLHSYCRLTNMVVKE